MTSIDLYSMTTVPIEPCANGIQLASATGFIWRDGPQHYLITNWHVVTGRNARTNELAGKVQPDMLRVLFNTKIQNFGKQQCEIRIRDADHRPCWYTHPVRKRGCDVVAVPLLMTADDPVINMYPINTQGQRADLAVRIGMEVFILGYPFGSPPPGFPVWKRGSIASEPDLTRIGAGYMLVDTASRPGMSGAPVIRHSWGAHITETGILPMSSTHATKLIGIYSGRLYTADQTDAQLGMVWPVEDIEEVVAGKRIDD